MPRVIKGPDGVVRSFPDDATDDEIASALDAAVPAEKPAHVEKPAPFKSESGFRGIEAVADAVRAIPDVARNLFSRESRAATLSGAKEGVMAGTRDFAAAGKSELGGAKDMAVATGQLVRHPIDTATGMAHGFADAARAVPDIVRNTVGPGATAETRKATGKGLSLGLAEGVSGVDADQAAADPLRAIGGGLAMVAGGKVLGSAAGAAKRTIRSVGGARTAAAATAAAERAEMARVAAGLGGDVPADVVAQGLGDAKPAPPVAPGPRLVKKPVPSIEQQLADVLEEGRKPEAPPVELPPPAFSNGAQTAPRQPRVTVAGGKTPKAKAAAGPPGRDGHFKLPEPRAKLNDAQLADVERRINGGTRPDGLPDRRAPRAAAPATEAPPTLPHEFAPVEPIAPEPVAPSALTKEPGIPTVSADGQKVVVRPKPGVASGMRNMLGSDKAARALGISKDDLRRAAPGPSRRPLAVDLAEMDNDYARRIADERGFIDPKAAMKIGVPVAGATAGAAMDDDNPLVGALLGAGAGVAATNPGATAKRFNELRAIAMLSGGALPKSVLGNVGAHLTAAGEMGSMAPIKEMLRLPENFKNAARGFKAQTQPGGSMTSGAKVQGLGRLNLPGRLMGALDEASQASLQRAGVPAERAAQLQLMEQNPAGVGTNALQRGFNTRIGQFAVPFQRVPLNQWAQGVESLDGLLPRAQDSVPNIHNSGRGRALTAGAIGAGAVAGDQKPDPLTLAMIAALAGPRALPFALGAGASVAAKKGRSSAKSVLERVGVGLPEGSISDLLNPTRAIDKPALVRFIQQLQGQQ